MLVIFPYRQVHACLKMALTICSFCQYCSDITLNPFEINKLEVSSNVSKEPFNRNPNFIAVLKFFIWGVITPFLKGPWSCILKGYAGSPYTQNGSPAGETANCAKSCRRPESASMSASCFLPSKQIKKHPTISFFTGKLF